DWLLKLLKEIQLDQFYIKLRDDLQVTRLSHFDYVKPEDLEGIGMGRPAIRRLLDCVKKHQGRKSFLTKILPVKQSVTTPQQQPTSPVMLMSSMMSSNSDALKCLINEKDLHFVCKLGDGSFGVVRKAIWMTSPVNKVDWLIPVAVKTLKGEMDGSMEEFMDEVRTMYSLDHPNIIHLYGVVLSNPLMMVTELAPLGSLLTYLRHPDHHCRNLPLLTTLHSYMLQICDGLVYLQSLHLIHRDLAARNIFMMSLERVKIGDFGLMRSLSSHGDHYVMSEKKKMPFAWCAPESLKLRHFSHASDCWMVGVVMWEIFSGGEEPWVGLNGGEILQRIDSPNDRLVRPRRCPSRFYEHILKKCWACRPSDRPDFKTLK
ncbi:hypothetical protein HELRODRAFT_122144, partial [Helobdella robusta]|uniref:non-specific protein-tyrosine kinase n=1 Tax=Helobdella robusta TaxID=6412 RepID=T1EGU2_HELRO